MSKRRPYSAFLSGRCGLAYRELVRDYAER